MTIIPEKFISVGINELPEDKRPKYKVGDLVLIQPGSERGAYGFYLKDGMGIIVDVCPFKVVGFDYYSPHPIYVIEYKIRRAEREDYCYVLETSIELVETDHQNTS